MSEAFPAARIIVGVDTHKHVHAAVAISGLGARLGTITAPACAKGYRDLEAWAQSLGAVQAFGVEGTGSYGAGLSRFLSEQGHAVLEVTVPTGSSGTSTAKATRSTPRRQPARCSPVKPRPCRRPLATQCSRWAAALGCCPSRIRHVA